METSTTYLLTAQLTPAEGRTQHQSCFPSSPEKTSSQNTPQTDVCTALTLQLTTNKLVTALFLLPCIWEDPANHIIQKDF